MRKRLVLYRGVSNRWLRVAVGYDLAEWAVGLGINVRDGVFEFTVLPFYFEVLW